MIISAVIIGGTALVGGRGNLVGTFLGVAFLGVLQNGMDLVGLQAFWQLFIAGRRPDHRDHGRRAVPA